MADGAVAADGVQIPVWSGGQQWLVSWHPPPEPPDGTPHGAEGVCVTADGDIVVISPDGTIWDLPAGRPEPGESWEQTLCREMNEEACATVIRARLLGFTRGQCVTGPERGLILVRSVWRADVELRPWQARFEIADRRVVAPAAVEDDSMFAVDLFTDVLVREDGTSHVVTDRDEFGDMLSRGVISAAEGRRAVWDNYPQRIPAGHDTVVHARHGFLSACPVHGAGLPGHC
jgi:ADP-ribose pyrophosphatase YjhB (NUDIX family)